MSTLERQDRGNAAALGIAEGLGLAAAPIFAIMALLTSVGDGAPVEILCGAAHEASPFSGMVPMYLLMSAVHTVPWLKLIARRLRPALTRKHI